MHTAIIISTVILWAAILIVAIGSGSFFSGPGSAAPIGIIILISYIIYLICVCCCNDIKGYITNLKKFDDYSKIYDAMVAGKGYFRFWIECYHYRTVRTKNGTRRQKVVTHTATENYFPDFCQDMSGNLAGINDITKYVFVNYLKKFFFDSQKSEDIYNQRYSSFVSRNRRDQYQNYTSTFEIENFQAEVGFCALGESAHNSIIFYLTLFLGLALPYSCILERAVSRYAINIVKKLSTNK